MKSRWIFYSLFFFNHILHSQPFRFRFGRYRPAQSRSLFFLVATVQKIGLQRLIIMYGLLNFLLS